jgi:hypothetical protein
MPGTVNLFDPATKRVFVVDESEAPAFIADGWRPETPLETAERTNRQQVVDDNSGVGDKIQATLAGEGVEKTIPLHSPLISKVEIISTPKKVHRSKMYFVREISRKSLRRKTAVTADKVAKVEKSAKAAKTEETK